MPLRGEFDLEEVLELFDGGANSKDDSEKIPLNKSPNPRGVDFDAKTIRKAAGYTLFGAADTETVPGFGFYNHRILNATEILVKSVNTSLKFYDPITSQAQLLTDATFTAGLRWFFASFNAYMYGGNGTDALIRWKAGAWGAAASAIAITDVTITLGAGEGTRFDTTGNGMIEGDTFSWTGLSTDTLTGVTGLSAAHASGSRVITKLDSTSYTTLPKGSVGTIFNNRLIIRPDATPNFIYFSKLADNTNPHDDLVNFTIAGSGAGDSGFDILPAAILGMQQFTNGDNSQSLIVFCADGIAREIIITDSTTSTVVTHPIYKNIVGDLAGTNTVASTESSLLLIDSRSTIRDLGYSDVSTIIRTRRLSDDIAPTAEAADFSSGTIKYFLRRAFFIGKQNGAAVNNFTIVKDTNPDAFAFYDHWQFNALEEWQNNLYGLSSVNGNIYKLFDGLNAAGAAIGSSYPTPRLNFRAPLNLKELRKLRVSGYITSGCDLYFDIYLDDDETPTTFLINGSNTNVTDATSSVAFGTVVFGRGVFGGSLGRGSATRRFIAELNLSSLRKIFTAQIVVRNTQADVDFEIQTMRLFARLCSADLMVDARHIGPTT